ncbi:MAG: hypothetical protein Rubg2KO_14450 [Rubricoccaceae bacterium]
MASLWSGLRLLLVVCLVLSTQSLLLIQGAFTLRQDGIAERFCVNRDRPDIDCDGHCVLMGRLGEHHKHKDESGTDALALALSFVPLVGTAMRLVKPTVTEPSAFAPVASAWGTDGHPVDVFRPPKSA